MRSVLSRLSILAALAPCVVALGLAVRAYRGDLLAGRLARTGDRLPASEYLETARECLRLNPSAWKPVVPMATALGRKGDVPGTRELVNAALSRHRPFEALLLDAALASEGREASGSIPRFEELRRIAPASRPVAQYLLGLAAALPDDTHLERVAREIDSTWPGSFDALVALSDCAFRDGNDAEGLRLLLGALDAAPASPAEAAARPRPAIYDPDERRAMLRAHQRRNPR